MTEIFAGIVIGPSVLDIVDITAPLQVFAQIGLVFLFFLAGLEIAFDAEDRHLGVVGAAFLASLALALVVALIFEASSWSGRRCSWRSSSPPPRSGSSWPCSRTRARRRRRSASS